MSYTFKQKYDYHRKRMFNPAEYGLTLYGNEHLYSIGFSDGVNGCDNRKAINSGSYSLGYNNGVKCKAKSKKN